jgi:hypothetical protein
MKDFHKKKLLTNERIHIAKNLIAEKLIAEKTHS